MEFHVNLIMVEDKQTRKAQESLKANCTHVGDGYYLFEGELWALEEDGVKFRKLDEGIVGPLGDLSKKELFELCYNTFDFFKPILKKRKIEIENRLKEIEEKSIEEQKQIKENKINKVDKYLKELDGSDHGQGAIEDASATADNTAYAIAKLLCILVEEKVINEDHADYIVDKYKNIQGES